MIVTKRLILRLITIDDVPALCGLWTDPEVTLYMGGPRNYKEVYAELVKDAKGESPPKFDLWPLIEKATGKTIGHCGIIDKEVEGREEIELVYVLAKDVWGKGYATEIASALVDYAFQEIGLNRIISLIDVDNVASEHVAKKIGMKHERNVVRPGGIKLFYAKNKSCI